MVSPNLFLSVCDLAMNPYLKEIGFELNRNWRRCRGY